MKKYTFIGLALYFAVILWGSQAFAEHIYSHQEISDWLWEPKVWVNEQLQVLWSEGEGYDTLTLYDDGATIQLTEQLLPFSNAVMNNRGHVAWIETNNQVYFFDGDKTIKITDGTVAAWNLDINEKGHLVWDANDETGRNIYLFDGKKTKRLTASGVNGTPKISEKDDVAWVHRDEVGGDFEVYYYDGHNVRQLTFNDIEDDRVQMSASGHVVWLGFEGQNSDVYFFDRHNVLQLTDDETRKILPTVTAKGQAFWLGLSDSGAEHFEIYTFFKGAMLQITDNDFDDGNYQTNGKGRIVWQGWAGSTWPWEIFFFDGHNILRLTDNETFDMNPVLNNRGFVVWTHHKGDYIQSGELHLYDGSSIQALTSDNPPDRLDVPKLITDKGDIIYLRKRAIGTPGAEEFYVKVFLAIKN